MIIVTGGAGFIGSNLLAKLEEKGLTNLVVCDYLGTEDKWRNIAKRELRDIVHPDNLLHYMDKHDGEIQAVFHMGAPQRRARQHGVGPATVREAHGSEGAVLGGRVLIQS